MTTRLAVGGGGGDGALRVGQHVSRAVSKRVLQLQLPPQPHSAGEVAPVAKGGIGLHHHRIPVN